MYSKYIPNAMKISTYQLLHRISPIFCAIYCIHVAAALQNVYGMY